MLSRGSKLALINILVPRWRRSNGISACLSSGHVMTAMTSFSATSHPLSFVQHRLASIPSTNTETAVFPHEHNPLTFSCGLKFQYDTSIGSSTSICSSRRGYENPRRWNRRERMERILERDGHECVWCRTGLTLDVATTDHVIPRIKGGPSWIENEMASCSNCNKRRGHMMPLQYADECEKDRRWDPNREAIGSALFSLEEAIAERGGQRKARPHLGRQLRLWKKRYQ